MLLRFFLITASLLSAATEKDGTTPLHRAAHRDDVAAARQLLKDGADAKAANRYGITPLSLACTNGSAAMVELLLEAGAEANAELPGGETPLMTAARSGSAAAVRALLRHGAKVDAKDARRGQTALMWAAAEGHAEVIRALLEAGADLNYRVDSGFTAFLFAAREGRLEAVRTLLAAGAPINQVIEPAPNAARRAGAPRAGTTALHFAVGNAHYDLASFLLDAGADPNAAGNGWTALHSITGVRKPGGGDNNPAPYGSGSMTSLEMVRKLVAKGANINARLTRKINVGLTALNTNGATAYLLAARSADAELLRLLKELGADVSIPTVDGATPIIAAAGLGTRSPGEDAGTDEEVVEALQVILEHGADPNHVDKNGETAMHGAAYKNLPGAVRFLATHGAKVEVWNKANKNGWTPLGIAEGYRFGNFKPSPVTEAAIREALAAAHAEPAPSRRSNRSDYLP